MLPPTYCGKVGFEITIASKEMTTHPLAGDMTRLWQYFIRWKIWRDERGQDLIEYALMVGFMAVAAGAVFPPLADNISTIFSKVDSMTTNAAAR